VTLFWMMSLTTCEPTTVGLMTTPAPVVLEGLD
jgi:hypothetical protein